METSSPVEGAHRYRPDIDGLRAVAVLLVVFSHAGLKNFDGGFIGVDVFFVISGYLISGILLREIPAGTFSFSTFYERRVRRIAPALLAMFLGVLWLARHYYFPDMMFDLAQSLTAALFFSSNFYFMHDWKYFDTVNQARPLLHTWSLAVEEQYYLAFPVLLVAIHRWWPRARKPVVWALAALSFAAVYTQMHYAYGEYRVSFFLSPLRAWELLIGTILYDLPRARTAWQRNLMSAAGLLFILIPAYSYNAQMEFPGLAALPPCLGAALVIAAGETGPSLTASLLSWAPVRFIGLISYSLYLVHWPILLFQRDSEFLVDAERHPRWVTPVVLGVSLLAATISWRFIEMPFRQGRLRPSRRQLYSILSPIAASLLIVCCIFLYSTGWGIPKRLFDTPAYRRYAAFQPHGGTNHSPGNCFVINNFAAYTPLTCLTIEPHRQNWLLLGDSHSGAMYEGLHKTFPGVNISQATMTGCWVTAEPSKSLSESCNRLQTFLFKDYLLHQHVDHLILVERWGLWMHVGLDETLAYLTTHGIDVVVVGPSIEYDTDLRRLVVLAERHNQPVIYSSHRLTSAEAEDRTIARIAAQWKVPYISMYADLCHRDAAIQDPPWQVRTVAGCPVFAEDRIPLLKDDNHLTPEGSLVFAQAIKANHQLP